MKHFNYESEGNLPDSAAPIHRGYCQIVQVARGRERRSKGEMLAAILQENKSTPSVPLIWTLVFLSAGTS